MTVNDTIEIFRRVLETPEVGPDSGFFYLGCDSLLGTRVRSAVARATGVELTFDDFLLAATPGALAKRVAESANPA